MNEPLEAGRATGLAFNPYIAALPAYNAGLNIAVARSISGRQDIARLASNENADGCSPAVLAALSSPLIEPWRYADPACAELRAALGERFGIDPATIVVGNGSEEMIAAVSRAVLVPGARVVTVVPSFGLHEIEPLAQGAEVRKVAMTRDLDFDVEELVDAIASGPRIVFLSSPWNPVGPALAPQDFERLVAAVPPGTLLVLDEAYHEFADNSPNHVAVMTRSGIPFVVLRTFSKAYGLAGLRVGYAICSDRELARLLGSAKTPFNVNAAAQAAALAAQADEAWMAASAQRMRVERHRVEARLKALSFPIAPSQANFLFFDTGADAAVVAAELLKAGIIVKAWREPGYERFMRVTIGTPQDNDRFLAALETGSWR